MVALEEGLLDLDDEVRDGFSLRHLLSHCAGLPEAGLRWQEPPEFEPGTQRWYSNAGYVQAARLLEAASGHAVRRVPARGRARAARHGRLARAGAGRRAAHRARLAAGALRRGRALQLGALPARRAAAGRRLRDARGPTGSCSRACSPAAPPSGGALLAQETVDEMLAPQFGPLPGGVNGVGEWPDLCWGLGFDVRGEREPHWAGAVAEPARREPLRCLGHARLARSRARPRPRGAREPRQLQRLVARAVGCARRRCDGGRRRGVDPAMKRIRTRPGAGPEAFDDLVEAHLGDVHRYLVYLTGDRTLADDLTADAFERAWKQRDRFDPRRAGPRSWLLTIARSCALDHLRAERRRGARERLAAMREPGRDAEDAAGLCDGYSAALEAGLAPAERRRPRGHRPARPARARRRRGRAPTRNHADRVHDATLARALAAGSGGGVA